MIKLPLSLFYQQKKFFPLRRKLLLFFTLFFFLNLMVSFYLIVPYRISLNFFNHLLQNNYQLEELSQNLQALLFYTENYLRLGTNDNLINFYKFYNNISNLNQERIKNHYPDLFQIINNILEESQESISLKSQNIFDTSLSNNIGLAQEYISKLINENNFQGNRKYLLSKNFFSKIERHTLLLFLITTLLSINFIYYLTTNITKPLVKIMANAQEISKGNFQLNPIKVNSNDELKTIAQVFNDMTSNLYNLFQEEQKKIELERKLQEEKYNNLKMKNLLREAELKKLQNQINPHFLYNTLNTIAQVAILEDADQTGELIKKIACLLRYNLKEASALIPLKDELNNIKTYCEIMEVRYGKAVKFEFKLPKNIEKIYVPNMILQPLIENAFLHGIANLKQGKINLSITTKNNFLLIKIRDNGQGMPKEEIRNIFNQDNNQMSGLKNIKERLELFYKEKGLIEVTSKKGEYTEIKLKLPFSKEVNNNV